MTGAYFTRAFKLGYECRQKEDDCDPMAYYDEDTFKKQTCETCRYWIQDESIDPNNMFGICETYGIEGRYHFCGHWESKD